MKKIGKRLLSVMLSMMILMSVFALMGMETVAAEKTEVKEGDLITFGSYPQTEVKDKNLLNQLNKLNLNWQSYGYYSGDYVGPSGGDYSHGRTWASWDTMKPGDFMKYADVSYNGEKYRAVTFTEQRPSDTGAVFSKDEDYQYQNGYIAGNVYWFKYEPLQWRVIDPEKGLVLCELIVDSQAYNNTTYKKEPVENPEEYYYYEDDLGFYGDPEHTYYSNNYAHSSIRAWLNDDFYNTAFNSSDKSKITETVCENRSIYSYLFEIEYPDFEIEYPGYPKPEYPHDAEETKDNVFLLSFGEVYFNEAGDYISEPEMEKWKAIPTDYAKCQGVIYYPTDCEESIWWLRTASNHANLSLSVDVDGSNEGTHVTRTFFGVRPAMRITEFGEAVTPPIEDNDNDVVEITDFTLNYKGTTKIPVNDKSGKYTITFLSSDESVATVDEEGNVTAVGTGEAEIIITITDSNGIVTEETCKVSISYAWWQWIIIIILFGWIWY